MQDTFDYKAYLASGRLLNENFEPTGTTYSGNGYIDQDQDDVDLDFPKKKTTMKERVSGAVRQALTEKKKPKAKPEDIDIESAFTKEKPEAPVTDEDSFMDEPSNDEAPIDVNPVNTTGNEQKPGFSKEEQEIQNSLKIAYDHALSIGDQKLATQIGNSLKFFISTHIVAGGLK